MEDREIEYILIQYFERQASDDELEYLKEWIVQSDENLQTFLKFKNIWEVSHPAFNSDSIDVEQAYENITSIITSEEKAKKPRKTIFEFWRQIAAIIVLPLLAVSGYLVYQKLSYNEPPIIYQEVYCSYGSRSLLTLPDNSTVWLNAGSKLKFPTHFNGTDRVVYLEGEAYFEVESDVNNPFVVKTKHMDVKSTGTKFNVESMLDKDMGAVTLVDGKLNVLFAGNDRALKSGERVYYNNADNSYQIEQTNTYKWCAWKDGIFAFRDDPLEYVFERLGQMYNIKFVVRDAEVAKYIYRATFKDESLEQILKLLEVSAPITFKKKQEGINYNTYFEQQEIEVYKRPG